VLLVGDIDRGGIFAQLLGTLWLLSEEERRLVKGLLVNKFRGDPSLFADGVRILEERGGVPVVGVIPWLADLAIPEEDAVALDGPQPEDNGLHQPSTVDIAVIHLRRIANFDDYDPLQAEPGVHLRYVAAPEELGSPDAIILPGTKATVADLEWLRQTGLAEAIRQQSRAGIRSVVGICGGYQMLGEEIADPEAVESVHTRVRGLGLLPTRTFFERRKETHRARARLLNCEGWLSAAGSRVEGYEIHMGHTESPSPWLEIERRNERRVQVADGAISDDRRIWGCYLHGLFENDAFRRAWLRSLGWRPPEAGATLQGASSRADLASRLDRLADAVERAVDMERLESIIWVS
jgi:adenosylcobyric acid synthase